jgi:membrane protease YdiL (CAAX protease family)
MARRSTHARSSSGALTGLADYAEQSRRPLQILLFLAPLIIAYELALAFVLGGGGQGTVTVAAHRVILRLLVEMGFPPTVVLYLGGVVLVILLLSWHVLRRDPWRADGIVAVGMAAESMLLAVPLLAVATLLSDPGVLAAAPAPASAGPSPGPGPGLGPGELGLGGSLAISVGAGLYEELFFRWMLIAVLHTLLVDVAHLGDRTGTVLAVIASAAAFTVYHDLSLPGGGIDHPRMVFLAIAGLAFGATYAVRGFGIVVGMHAAYDIVTVLTYGPEAITGG